MLLFFLQFLSAVSVLEKYSRLILRSCRLSEHVSKTPSKALINLHGKNELFLFEVDVSEEMFVSEA